jgi:pimeloyl-ACP methyl ester carboxylesterase
MNKWRFAAAACLLWGCSGPAFHDVVAGKGIREEQIQFRNGDATLAGTLFLPTSDGTHPAVVLFHGSGPEPRNTSMGRWFAEQGIAAVTYDKRGVGESTGDFRTVPFTNLVDDGLAAISFLKARADIDSNRIGVWGLSQGGWLGPLAASRSADVSFVVAVSGPGVSPGEQMIFYYGNQLRDQGVPEEQIVEASDLRRRVWHYLSTGEGYEEANHALQRAQSRPWFAALREQPDGLFNTSPASAILHDRAIRARMWFKVEMNYDPRIALRKLTVPALFLFGEHDELVPVQRSVDIIRKTLTESGHGNFTIKIIADADHTIRSETPDGRRQFAPGYLETISDWVRKVSAK